MFILRAALIITAGKTSSKTTFTPLQPVGSITAIERIIHTFQLAGIERIVVVGGSDLKEIEKQVAKMGVVCFSHEQPETAQMLDFIQLGLAYLENKCESVFISPVNIPLFTSQTIALLSNENSPVVIPSFEKKAGHPIVVRKSVFSKLLSYKGPHGLKGAIDSLTGPPTYISTLDRGILINIQKEKEYSNFIKQHSLQKIHPKIQLYLAKEQNFFGPGPALLLQLVEETQSLSKACKQMGISYSKGFKIIETIETQLGVPVIKSSRGGNKRGQSYVTNDGKKLLYRYNQFLKEADERIKDLFKKHFKDL